MLIGFAAAEDKLAVMGYAITCLVEQHATIRNLMTVVPDKIPHLQSLLWPNTIIVAGMAGTPEEPH